MSETTELEKKTRPWQWPGEWFRDEKFWREVTARGLSGIIVLVVGYWAAVWLGYIDTPDGKAWLALAILILWPTLGLNLLFRLLLGRFLLRKFSPDRMPESTLGIILVFMGSAFGLLALVAGIEIALFHWLQNNGYFPDPKLYLKTN